MILEYNKKPNKGYFIFKKIIFSPPVLILFFIILLIFLTSTIKVFVKSREVFLERKEVDKKLEDLKLKRDELKTRISKLETESGVERELIEKFQIKKPGEEVLVILDPKEQKNNQSQKRKAGFFSNFWQSVKRAFK
jgi:cell division protein FtsB